MDRIANAFVAAVVQMYSHTTLRYQWMRYLENMKTYSWDPFWAKLADKIGAGVRETCILQPRRQGVPVTIKTLRLLDPLDLDTSGNPLYEDLLGLSECYISTGYQLQDLLLLVEYGLTYINTSQVLARLKHDLLPVGTKSQRKYSDWHARVARRLNHAWNSDQNLGSHPDGIDAIRRLIKDLAILPLRGGNWVSANAGKVFFPSVGDNIWLPGDVDLPILTALACGNADQVKLFTNLGAMHADIESVRAGVTSKYVAPLFRIGLQTSYSHLVSLYRTHTVDVHTLDDRLGLYDTTESLVSPRISACFFPSDDTYSPWQLAQRDADGWLVSNVCFINETYLESPPQRSDSLSWKEWLGILGVRTHPRLVSQDGHSLSPICLHVAQNLRSDFMGFLRYAWQFEDESVLKENILSQMRLIRVPCEGSRLWVLSKSYLPLPHLQQTRSDFGGGCFFPFLELGEPVENDKDTGKWSFLQKHLGVGAEDNLRFYVDLLHYMRLAWTPTAEKYDSRVLDVYARIYSQYQKSPTEKCAQEHVQ